jgi:hypothetical protein
MPLKHTGDLRKISEKAIKSLCLTTQDLRWLPPSATVFLTGDNTAWEEDCEERLHRTIE